MTLPRHTLPGMHLRHAAIPRDATPPQPRLYPGRQRNPPPCPERPPSHLPLPRYTATSAYHPSLPTRSSPMAAAHSSLRTRRPGGSQFLLPSRTADIVSSRSQSPAARPRHLPYPPAGITGAVIAAVKCLKVFIRAVGELNTWHFLAKTCIANRLKLGCYRLDYGSDSVGKWNIFQLYINR